MTVRSSVKFIGKIIYCQSESLISINLKQLKYFGHIIKTGNKNLTSAQARFVLVIDFSLNDIRILKLASPFQKNE